MPSYQWKGKTKGGKVKDGIMVAGSKNEVIAALRKQAIIVSSVKEKGKEISLPKIGGGKVDNKDIAVFTRQFSFMIDAGMPINQCLEILGVMQENQIFQAALYNVREDIESGSNLADALGKHPKIFNELYINMVAAGETGGILDIILRRLAEYIEKSVALKRAIKSAMVYPIAVIIVAIIVVAVILWKVIPVFAGLFAGMNAEMPLPTRITVAMSEFLQDYMPLIIVGVILLSMGYKAYYKTSHGHHLIDSIKLKLPVFGVMLQKMVIARFCRTMATLISSGVPLLDSLEITAKTAGNIIVEEALMYARTKVEGGSSLSEPLQDSELFPPLVTQMIQVGEQTGEIDAMISKVAEFYEDEVDIAVENLLALMEPLLIAFLGVSVGGIVVSMYLPMFSLMKHMSEQG
ncbi:MAG: type II secretion system F family protein [Acidobacteria bacterium]|nr:type II secretion system F family protein [Acidobacteriota bacterium]